ncbi:MAG: alpha/beta fold hydrolase [Alphaproteobacteria bacterium]|nr:alpha/beta fold hydrolase [Alphaproteobacteria bacterium]
MLAGAACVSFPDAPQIAAPPAFLEDRLRSIDGVDLPTTVWAADDPQAIVVALHGMNDYANAFAMPAAAWASRGVTTYALDQRGFGRGPGRGRWPGAPTLKADLRAAVTAARAAHPILPVYVVGHSMGGAVALAALGDEESLDVDGVVLAAPAVWGGARMPLFYRIAINLAATFAPGKTATGERAGRQPTDNIDVMRAMAADPVMIGPTRLDAALGIVRLMGEAWRASAAAEGRILVLVGEKDEIIPPDDVYAAAERLSGDVTVKTYPDGWHLLFRDIARAAPTGDAADWMLRDANG